MTLLIISLVITIGIIITISWIYYRRLKLRRLSEITCKLYQDWIVVFDMSDDGTVFTRVCFIEKVLDDGTITVRVPSLDNTIEDVVWIPYRNNFYFKRLIPEDPTQNGEGFETF